MTSITRQLDVSIKLTIEDIANGFCDMDAEHQADFFNVVAENIKKWDSAFVFQLQSVTVAENLTDDGRQVMREIGEYSSKDNK